jgi:membrane protease YdiL (CAAX protease family)
MNNRIILKFCALSFLIAWLCWFILWILVNRNLVSYGDLIYMILYLTGGICPSVAGLIAIKSDNVTYQLLKAQIIRFKINILWYLVVIITPLLLSGFSWTLNLLIYGNSQPFLTNSIWKVIPMLPVMIVGGGLEEIGWRGVLLPKLLSKMSAFKSTLIVILIWGIWHLPLFFIKGLPQFGGNFVFFMCGIISLSFLMTILYIRTRSVFVCILFHALENAYLSIGLDSWPQTIASSGIIALSSVLIPLIIFRKSIHVNIPLKITS